MLLAMFVVTEADAAAIRAAFEQRGELSAAVELTMPRQGKPLVLPLRPVRRPQCDTWMIARRSRNVVGNDARCVSAASALQSFLPPEGQ